MASLQKQIIDFLSIPPAGKEEFRNRNRWSRPPAFTKTVSTTSQTPVIISKIDSDFKRSTEDSKMASNYATDVEKIKNSAERFQGIRADIDTVLYQVNHATNLSQIIVKSSLLSHYKEDVENRVKVLDISYALARTASDNATKYAEFPISIEKIYAVYSTLTNSKQWSDPANKAADAKSNAIKWLEEIKGFIDTGKEVLDFAKRSAIEGQNIKEAAPLTASDDTIKKQNNELDAAFSTKYAQLIYQEERNKTARFAIYWVTIVYWVLSFVFVYFLIYGKQAEAIHWKYKLLYIILVVIFPFVIVSIELFIKNGIIMLYQTTMGKPYEPSKWKIMGEPELSKKPSEYGGIITIDPLAPA
jgi:hypothetical protein